MNRVQFNTYIKKVEAKFAGKPEALRKKAQFYVVLSYLYIAAVLILTTALIVGLAALMILKPNAATIKIGLVFGFGACVLGISILRGLWVKTDPPKGRVLTKAEAPALFELLDELRDQVAPVRFHKVIVDGDFNAAVAQHPRLGMLGWYQNYLLLGLPLMQSIGSDEFRGVLAHEFGHLSNRDGTSGNWIYRIRASWEQMIAKLFESGGSGSWALMPFVNWFWPRFNGHAFVLSRLHEYRADSMAAKFAGADSIGRALQRIELRARWVDEEVWPPIFQRANDDPAVPENVYELVKAGISEPVPDEEARDWLKQSFSRITDYSDTHPALTDRLKAVDQLPHGVAQGDFSNTLPPVTKSAAEAFLGLDTEQTLSAELSAEWAEALRKLWIERHKEVQGIREKLGDESEITNAEGAWKWADAMLDLEGDNAAMPWIERTLGYDPNHLAARFVKARHLISKGDTNAVPMLETLASEENVISMEALGLLRMHYTGSGDADKLTEIDRKADRFDQKMELAQAERSTLTKSDTLLSHELSEDTLKKLEAIFVGYPEIKAVRIVRKQVIHMTTEPFFAVAVKKGFKGNDETLVNGLLVDLQEILEGAYYVFIANSDTASITKNMKLVPDSSVYQKEK